MMLSGLTAAAVLSMLAMVAVPASDTNVTTGQMLEAAEAGLASARAKLDAEGTSGLRGDVEACYRRVSRTHDKLGFVFCFTEDRWTTESDIFPDPFFNREAMATRASKGLSDVKRRPQTSLDFLTSVGKAQDRALDAAVAKLRAK